MLYFLIHEESQSGFFTSHNLIFYFTVNENPKNWPNRVGHHMQMTFSFSFCLNHGFLNSWPKSSKAVRRNQFLSYIYTYVYKNTTLKWCCFLHKMYGNQPYYINSPGICSLSVLHPTLHYGIRDRSCSCLFPEPGHNAYTHCTSRNWYSAGWASCGDTRQQLPFTSVKTKGRITL